GRWLFSFVLWALGYADACVTTCAIRCDRRRWREVKHTAAGSCTIMHSWPNAAAGRELPRTFCVPPPLLPVTMSRSAGGAGLPAQCGPSLQRNDAGAWLCEYPGLSFQRCPVRACSLVSSLLLNGATMSQESSLTQSAHSVRQVLTAYTA